MNVGSGSANVGTNGVRGEARSMDPAPFPKTVFGHKRPHK